MESPDQNAAKCDKLICWWSLNVQKKLLNAKEATYRRETRKYFCISANCVHNVTSSSSHGQLCLKKGYLSIKDGSPVAKP